MISEQGAADTKVDDGLDKERCPNRVERKRRTSKWMPILRIWP